MRPSLSFSPGRRRTGKNHFGVPLHALPRIPGVTVIEARPQPSHSDLGRYGGNTPQQLSIVSDVDEDTISSSLLKTPPEDTLCHCRFSKDGVEKLVISLISQADW